MNVASTISHNMLAANADRMLGIQDNNFTKSSEKLSSGYQVNRAADDAASLSISEKMRKRVRGLNQGAANMQDGISLMRVADGALAETQDILQRINELAVKSANGTMSASDRQDTNSELKNLKEEIDRIAKTTIFNEFIQPLLGNPKVSFQESTVDVPFADIKLVGYDITDVNIGNRLFGPNDPLNMTRLTAVVDKEGSAVNGKTFNLIYGGGSTSFPSVKIKFTDTESHEEEELVIDSDMFAAPSTAPSFNASNMTWSRAFTYEDDDKGIKLSLKQNIKLDVDGKKYDMSFTVKNEGDTTLNSMDFMYHVDTAYNNNDICEGYYVNGDRVQNISVIYANSGLNSGLPSSRYIKSSSNTSEIPGSFSVVDVDNALPFSEVISPKSGDKSLSMISVGLYHENYDWDSYDPSSIGSKLGRTTNRRDLGFALIYTNVDNEGNRAAMGAGASATFDFSYGIKATDGDPNLQQVQVTSGTITKTVETDGVWIQCSDESTDGVMLSMVDASCDGIKLSGADVSTVENARSALGIVNKSLKAVSEYRSRFGAYQNRMEHAYNINLNTSENTQAGESRIRDTDMAKEMMNFAKISILKQASQAMLSQANGSQQGVLSLLL